MESRSSSLADVLERVLDKGIVVAGDIAVNVVDIELLTLRVRLFIASAQTAKELGMDWWTGDPFFAPHSARPAVESGLAEENTLLRQKIADLERALGDQS
ncbi:gas vesicle protein [Actinocrispum sp. NPDC049592]|uniref:gas vesicle protein n=1 Tax=Actinocrispum sp. NPDC049592 TaxID=3154835 RepID=UPI0034351E8C